MASSNPTAPLNPISAVKPPPTVLQPSSGMILTVGAGMEFAKLGDALKAAVNGDTIAVNAGTYTNDFGTVTAQVRIVAVGGVVNEVATTPPPNDKGIITVENDLSIQGFTFTGGSDGSPDGNVAGIRLENGSLNVAYCDFHDMQEGLLAGANANANVTIDHSEFAHNGTGDGLSHNIYVGAVGSLTITNSYFHDAVVGHEIKSRAAVTTITNNIITDGPNGTASYDIDLPNGGIAKVAGNVIEKGPNASNWYAIHYSGETQFVWPNNALSVTGNTILNDSPIATGTAVLNQAAVNGLTTSASISGNNFYGFDPARLVQGAGTLNANTTLAAEPTYSQLSPWAVPPTVTLAAGPQLLNLVNGGHTVTGGTARLTVRDTGGSNTISGGAGGMTLAASASWDVISTQAGAADTLTLAAPGETLHSAGNDSINVTGNYCAVAVTGQATITGSTYSNYALNGAAEKLTTNCSCVLTVGSAGNGAVIDNAGDVNLSVAAGGKLTILDNAAKPRGGAAATAAILGGAGVTGWIGNSGAITLTVGAGGGHIQAGIGAVSITGGTGADVLAAGSGTDVFTLGNGADQVTFGGGTASVTGGAGADSYVFQAGSHGNDTITGFKQGKDSLRMVGFSGTGIASGTIVSGSTLLTLSDGTTIDLVGVALPGYSGTPAPSSGGGAPGGVPAPHSSAGTLQLTTSGQSVTGGAAQFCVADLVGGNTIAGGAGGLSAGAGTADLLTTQAGSASQIGLFRYDTLTGAGSDQVTASANGNIITESGAATIALLGGANIVHGGAGLLQVTDSVAGNTIAGGAGGIVATLGGAYDLVTTDAHGADTVSLGGRDMMLSQGRDVIAVAGQYNQITATGSASITAGAGSGTYDLEGTDTLATAGAAAVTVGHAASATVSSANADAVGIVKLAGGTLAASDSVAGGLACLTVSGGAATVSAASGLSAYLAGGVNLAAGSGPVTVTSAASGAMGDSVQGGSGSLLVNAVGSQGLNVVAGTGNVTLNGGAGNDVFVGGAGQALLNLGTGADTVTLGAGSITVQGGSATAFVVPSEAGGTLVVQNWTAQDTLSTPGLSHPVIASQVVTAGSTWLTLMGGAHIELVGVTHFT